MAAIDGPALKDWRVAKGWSAKEFAHEAGISLQYLCDIEGGHRNLKRNPGLIKTFAKILGIPTTRIEHHQSAAPA
jgi:transcriptional regulator with XRE-family HTH domain